MNNNHLQHQESADALLPTPFFKALSDSTRLQILLLITQHKALCVCDLTDSLLLSQPKISRHLALLREHNILQDERRKKWMFYQLHPSLNEWQRSVLYTCLREYENQVAPINARLARCLQNADRC
ncbi:metalloregulator ArsR/SmtB family transcription factor [Aestuariibacter sp. AA17]|uniref:Metalloregulator ArsR/SmtB family transcription factor n=1 Tax=Fluctibacter corallii TaxID=2984329 RepID=A0ABT3ABD8_9ALTE|nr:metalloregulator ArsR/SmtB family transcription factor [Aestuariibacter sp. AA17]MCV2885985.1 metalloregulator ArsR/SmtB family transcription factor [Aestuariibacter sp. AA17]